MTDNNIIACTTDMELSAAPIDPSWIIEGTPRARNRVLAYSSDKSAWTMLWDCTAGAFRWTYHFDETVHILEGNVAVTDASGFTRTFGPGDVIFFPAGSVAEWRIASYVRKLAFCHSQMPVQLSLAWRVCRRGVNLCRKMFRIFPVAGEPGQPRPAREIILSGTFSTSGAPGRS